MTLLYLVRHGETALNQKGVYYGWTDCPLSLRGEEQAESLGRSLAGITFDGVIASPLERAKRTAQIVGRIPVGKLVLDPRLKELNFGDWEGKHYQEIQSAFPGEWQEWANDWKGFRIPGGESFLDLYRRVADSLSEILNGDENRTLLLVAHHATLRIILSRLLGMGEDGYWHFTFTQGTYSLVEIRDGHCTVKNINS